VTREGIQQLREPRVRLRGPGLWGLCRPFRSVKMNGLLWGWRWRLSELWMMESQVRKGRYEDGKKE
jgi:hypothetical protein